MCVYLNTQHGKTQAEALLDEIGWWYVLHYLGASQNLKLIGTTRDNFKALMKVYIPAIVRIVPNDIVKCLATFLEACYISQHQNIKTEALDALEHQLEIFKEL